MAPQDPAACRAPCRSPPGPVGALCGGNTSTSRLGWGRPTTWGSPRRRGASGQGGGSCSGQALVLLSRRGVGARAELPWTAGEGAGEPSGLPPPPRHRKTPAFKGQRLKAGSGPRRASTWPGPGGDWPSPINKDEERSPEWGPRAVSICKARALPSAPAAQRPWQGSGRDREAWAGASLSRSHLGLLLLALLPTNSDEMLTYTWTPAVLTPRVRWSSARSLERGCLFGFCS